MRFVDSPHYKHIQVVFEGAARNHWGGPKDVAVSMPVLATFFAISTDTDYIVIANEYLDEFIDGLQRLKEERRARTAL